MKRYLSILLALLMTFSLCACGSAAKMSPSTPEAAYDTAPAETPADAVAPEATDGQEG